MKITQLATVIQKAQPPDWHELLVPDPEYLSQDMSCCIYCRCCWTVKTLLVIMHCSFSDWAKGFYHLFHINYLILFILSCSVYGKQSIYKLKDCVLLYNMYYNNEHYILNFFQRSSFPYNCIYYNLP